MNTPERPDANGPDAIDLLEVEPTPNGTPPKRRQLPRVAAIVAAIVAVVIGVVSLTSRDGDAPAGNGDDTELTGPSAAIGNGTATDTIVELDADAENQRPATIEAVRRDGDTVTVALFVDNCAVPSTVELVADGDRIGVTATIGDTGSADCGEPQLVAVRVDLDDTLSRQTGGAVPLAPGAERAPN